MEGRGLSKMWAERAWTVFKFKGVEGVGKKKGEMFLRGRGR